MNTLSCRNLTKVYGKKTALTNINLTLEPHRIYGLIGRNGAGKTTLLGILSAQNSKSSGEVKYNDESIWENQKALNEVCFSREINTSILFGVDSRKIKQILTAAEIIFPYWDKEMASKLLNEFDLDPKKRINKLSKGMLSALTIIIALASKSPMTFMDEPVAGLDVFMRDKFYRILMEEFLNSERTFVVSTHLIDEVSNVLEDVIIIESGEIVKCENTQDMLDRHRIVAGKATDIDEFAKNYKVVHEEILGRSKTICIEISNFQAFEEDIKKYDFDVTQASLQKLFMQLL